MNATVRPATEADSAAVIAIVRTCWTAYPGVIFDLDDELPELKTFVSHYEARGGRAWVAEQDYRVVGCLAAAPEGSSAWMLCKLNVLPAARRRGIGRALVARAEAAARAGGATEMELWSDTRFTESHTLYESLGYRRLPETRALHDRSNTVEYHFRKML